jgi:hypothetical protein
MHKVVLAFVPLVLFVFLSPDSYTLNSPPTVCIFLRKLNPPPSAAFSDQRCLNPFSIQTLRG